MLCSLPPRNSFLISGVVISHLFVLQYLLSAFPGRSKSFAPEVLLVNLAGKSVSSSPQKKLSAATQANASSSKESQSSIQADDASSLIGAERASHLAGGSARQAVHSPRPHYPLISRKLREQGLVIVRLCVNEQGIVAEAGVSKSSGFQGLDQSALKALAQWRFMPAASHSNSLFSPCFQTPVQFTLEG